MPPYAEQARAARLKVLDMVYKAKSSHIGSNFSVIDIMTVLFANLKPNDQVILSAGWKAAAFYYFLAKQGHFPEQWLDTYNQEGSSLIGLTEPGIPGVLFAGGSMQMGIPAAVGFALAKKLKKEEGTVYCIMSDGELAGGMVWESYLIALHHDLKNLVVLVDDNGLQAMGDSDRILHSVFPGYANHVDGHDYAAIERALRVGGENIVFKTIKGKGVSWMENNNDWHYKDLKDVDYVDAYAQLGGEVKYHSV